MKSNAGCWTPPATTLLIAMLLLTGSRMGSFDRQAHCLPVVEYSAADQRRAADEIEALFEIGVVVRMTARLCRAAGSSADMQMSLGSANTAREVQAASTSAPYPVRFTGSGFQGAAAIGYQF